jgi:DNA-binding MarR family transcriptional regulator
MNAVHETLALDLSDPAARRQLPAQSKPYWMTLEAGLHLGLYKGSRGATWYARRFVGDRRYKQVKLGKADTAARNRNPTGMDFEQAAAQARAWILDEAPAAAEPPSRAPEVSKRLQPTRLDRISEAWAHERPDLDFWLPSFFLRIEYAHVKHEKRLEHVSKSVGVNIGDLHVLLALRRTGANNAMRPTDLFRELLVTSGAITKRIDRLVAMKLIERVAASNDRRSGPVRATQKGLEIADKAITQIDRSLTALVRASGLTKEELHRIDEGFRRLLEHM